MVTKEQRDDIRSIKFYSEFVGTKEGISFDNKKKVHIPGMLELKDMAFKRIIETGYSKIERVKPSLANCIVRVFYWRQNGISKNVMSCVYGYNCYVKENQKWLTGLDGNLEINFSEHKIGRWVCPDDYIVYNCDFADFYVKIT